MNEIDFWLRLFILLMGLRVLVNLGVALDESDTTKKLRRMYVESHRGILVILSGFLALGLFGLLGVLLVWMLANKIHGG